MITFGIAHPRAMIAITTGASHRRGDRDATSKPIGGGGGDSGGGDGDGDGDGGAEARK